MLFKTRQDVQNSWLADGLAGVLGNIRLLCDVFLRTNQARKSSEVQRLPTNRIPSSPALLGVKIHFFQTVEKR